MHSFIYKVTLEEYLRGKNHEVLKPEIKLNIKMLLFRINYIRGLCNMPFIITSGLRTPEEQHKINPKAVKSNHLIGAAIDISDLNGDIYLWCRANESILVDVGLWGEIQQGNWVHLQIYNPKSGNRWFQP